MTKNTTPDYSRRYSDRWQQTSRMARNMTENRCCYCWTRKAEEAHHAQYAFANWMGVRQKVRDREWQEIGRSIFPVCGRADDTGTCHHQLHKRENWIVAKNDRVWGNRNTPAMLFQLRLRFWLLRVMTNGLGDILKIAAVLTTAYVFWRLRS